MNARTLITVGLLAATAAPAYASGQSTLASGYSFVSSCSGVGFGGFGQSGQPIANGPAPAGQNCASQTSATVGGTASVATSASGTNAGYPYSGSSAAKAALGTFHLSALSNGSTATYFSGGQAMGGWNDAVTITGGTGQGIWIVDLHVDGAMSSVGRSADSQFGLEVFKDHNVLQPYGPSINLASYNIFKALDGPLNSNDVLYSWDYQMKPWRITDYGTPKSLTIDQEVYFAVPFTYGVSFTLGVFGQVSAAESSYSAYAGASTSTVDFSHTVSWAGKGQVVSFDSGTNTTGPATHNFTILSGSGFNYNLAAAPEPATWAMMLGGFGMVGAALRTRRKTARAFA